ncbi:hypothetical protein DMENIID0001_016020 [Sergentomyia squamirostris]
MRFLGKIDNHYPFVGRFRVCAIIQRLIVFFFLYVPDNVDQSCGKPQNRLEYVRNNMNRKRSRRQGLIHHQALQSHQQASQCPGEVYLAARVNASLSYTVRQLQ